MQGYRITWVVEKKKLLGKSALKYKYTSFQSGIVDQYSFHTQKDW